MNPHLVFLLLASVTAHAGPRTSASYAIATDTADAGGRRASSASYTNDGSLGGVVGISVVASPSETIKHGYIGQLYEVSALLLAASPATINETGTRQLSATQLLDDTSTVSVAASSVAWSVLSGPVTGISAGGLATAAAVYEDTTAGVQGMFAGKTGNLNLTVLNTLPDNFGAYAGDTIADSWQVQYFGQPPNPNAAPGFISDGSGLTNLFKYTAGLIPNDAASTFMLHVQPVTGQPTHKDIVYGPALADRTYTIEFSTALNGWQILTGPSAGPGGMATFPDLNAGPPSKFYRVNVTKP